MISRSTSIWTLDMIKVSNGSLTVLDFCVLFWEAKGEWLICPISSENWKLGFHLIHIWPSSTEEAVFQVNVFLWSIVAISWKTFQVNFLYWFSQFFRARQGWSAEQKYYCVAIEIFVMQRETFLKYFSKIAVGVYFIAQISSEILELKGQKEIGVSSLSPVVLV